MHTNEGNDLNYIVCAWHTPDYEDFANIFKTSAIKAQCPYDIIQVSKKSGGWERNTCRKAEMLQIFMDRYPDRTIILSDVDAIITGDLARLANIDCDIALHFTAKNKHGRTYLVPRSGTLVVHPTQGSRQLTKNWSLKCSLAKYGHTDESCLVEAIQATHNLRITAISGDVYSLIKHDCASKRETKVSNLKRVLRYTKDKLVNAFA